jgi:hypothetical protein
MPLRPGPAAVLQALPSGTIAQEITVAVTMRRLAQQFNVGSFRPAMVNAQVAGPVDGNLVEGGAGYSYCLGWFVSANNPFFFPGLLSEQHCFCEAILSFKSGSRLFPF